MPEELERVDLLEDELRAFLSTKASVAVGSINGFEIRRDVHPTITDAMWAEVARRLSSEGWELAMNDEVIQLYREES